MAHKHKVIEVDTTTPLLGMIYSNDYFLGKGVGRTQLHLCWNREAAVKTLQLPVHVRMLRISPLPPVGNAVLGGSPLCDTWQEGLRDSGFSNLFLG